MRQVIYEEEAVEGSESDLKTLRLLLTLTDCVARCISVRHSQILGLEELGEGVFPKVRVPMLRRYAAEVTTLYSTVSVAIDHLNENAVDIAEEAKGTWGRLPRHSTPADVKVAIVKDEDGFDLLVSNAEHPNWMEKLDSLGYEEVKAMGISVCNTLSELLPQDLRKVRP